MGNKLILTSALAFALASTGAAIAQTSQYDVTAGGGDHMHSYGAVTSQPSPQAGAGQSSQAPQPSQQRNVSSRTKQFRTAPVSGQTQATQPRSQFDSTGDHMFSYGPSSQ
jgi:hypothetical protein